MKTENKDKHLDSDINSEYINQIKSIIEDISVKTQEIDISKNNLTYFKDLELLLFNSFNKIEYLYKQLLLDKLKK
ncbi:MAG: hypothetical protein LBR11_03275 [Deltaproteobacteria bacterium]|jgi:hypothetical protein|nr:hypothetical protein [Deltaproteobacteria bacterium]